MPVTNPNRASSSFGPDMSQAGNGIPVYVNGQWSTIEIQALPPLTMRNGNGIGGNPKLGIETWLGQADDLDLSVAGDHAIPCNSACFVPTVALITMARGLVSTVAGALYTAPVDGRGDMIYDLPNAAWAVLTDDLQVITCPLATARRSADFMNLRLTAANDKPLKVSVWIFGHNLVPNDMTGRVF